MSELNPRFEDLARGMIEKDIVKFGDFTLKSGKKSVAYVNLREMISVPRLFRGATDAYASTATESGVHRTSDGSSLRFLDAIAEAANYYGGSVGYVTGMPLVQRRVKPKEHGQPRPVEGRFKQGNEVVLLDDVVTTSQSKQEEAEGIEGVGLVPKAVVVLVDREQGGRTELEAKGLTFVSAMTLRGIAKYALDENLAGVTQSLYDTLLSELDPVEIGAA